MNEKQELVAVRDLSLGFTENENFIEIIDSLSFSIFPGESVGLVGESGCGKTLTALSLIKLLPSPYVKITQGKVLFRGNDILTMPLDALREIRGREIGFIFQNSNESFNPTKKIGYQISEPLRIHFPGLQKSEVYEKSILMMKKAGIAEPEKIYKEYPHALSPGTLRRVTIVTAMIAQPDLLIADEPATTPDITIQAQIIDLIKTLQQEFKMTFFLISHNPCMAAELCKKIIVMYSGRIVEIALKNTLFHTSLHPYTKGFFSSIPRLAHKGSGLKSIRGSLPPPGAFLRGCRFMPRCNRKIKKCNKKIPPPLFLVGPDHYVACWLFEKMGRK
ncbi:MAG: ABC transporter ATP-binding protein [Spirochaetales bacterium]|nr:ABC transporter ATP-binding protein [Spirochaetales bacterium]